MPPLLRLFASGLLASLLTPSGFASTQLANGYSIRVWQTDDGLPQNLVTSAVQTRDGYLWFGTESGLARFDGERFKVFNSANTPALSDRRITCLFEDGQGTMWIGHTSGAISRYRDGVFDAFAPAPGVENERVIGLGSDEQGRLWAMRDSGAIDALLDGSTRIRSLIAPEAPSAMGWTRAPDGNIWVIENGTVARLADGQLSPLSLPPPRFSNYVQSVGPSAAGGTWLNCDGRIRRWENNAWVDDRGESPQQGAHLLRELRDGTLAIGTLREGLHLRFPDGRPPVQFHRENGLPQNWIRFLYEDREGNLWIGTGSAGLVSIRPTAFATLHAPDRWDGSTVLSVAPGRGDSLWVGTDGAGLYHFSSGGWKQFSTAEGLGNQYIWSVTETATGEVWAGHYWWGGPFRLEDGRFVRPENVDESWSAAVALVSVPETGELLVGNRDGLLRLKTGEPSRWLIRSPKGSTDDVCSVVRDRAGVIWCGFAQGGLARLAGEQLSIFRRNDGLGSDTVQCLFADEDGSLWIGTADAGLTRFKDGRFSHVKRGQGLADDVVSYILDDASGHFWLSTHRGIQRVAKDELNRCADGLIPEFSSQIYDRSDGLPIVEFTGGRQGAGCKTSDGRLWFTSSQGLLSVDPSRIRPNPLPPPVVFDSLVVDGTTVDIVDARVPGRLAPDHQRLEFRFSGLSFVAPSKVQFKYQLEGIDKTWIDSGSKRTASYSRLPAGDYRFRVIACNSDGVWNTTGALVDVVVAPFFWQTWWFVGMCFVVSVSGVALLARFTTRRRMQQRLQRLERKHAIERERARIARDIHDDVGASLARIAMLSQPGRSDVIESQRTVAMLSRIYSTARDMTRSLDEIVWAVDPRHDTLDSLVSYIGEFAMDFLSAADVRCRLDPPVELPTWRITADTRHNLFLAFKEALNNVLRHAHATEVRVSLSLKPDTFVLTIQDNGRGFATDELHAREPGRIASGHGLSNMERRLAGIGGRCEIASVAGHGTTVSFFVAVSGHPGPLHPQPDALRGDAASRDNATA